MPTDAVSTLDEVVETPSATRATNERAETDLVGAVNFAPDVYAIAKARGVTSTCFAVHRLRFMWRAFETLNAGGYLITPEAVRDELNKAGHADIDPEQIFNPTTLNVERDADLVVLAAARRTWQIDLEKQARQAHSQDFPIPEKYLAGRILSRPRFEIHAAGEALQPQPPIDWLLDGLVSTDSVSVFYGHPGTKKTYSLLSLGVCVAAGKPWLGMETKAARVLVIDEESGESRLKRRLAEVMRGELVDDSLPLKFISLAAFHLDNPADVDLLERVIVEGGAQLVIFDALADLMGGDENSKEDVQPIFTALRRLADRTGAALVVIHHAGKSGDYRGSSAIKGAVDLLISVKSENGSEFIDFDAEKNRDNKSSRWAARAAWAATDTGVQFTLEARDAGPKVKAISKSCEFIVTYLTKHGPSPLPEIMAAADVCSAEAARKAAYSLAGQGVIYRINPGETGQGVSAIYSLKIGTPNE